MINVFMYLSDAKRELILRDSVIKYFAGVKCPNKITSCSTPDRALAYIERPCSDDIFIFDFSDFDKAAVLARLFYKKNPLGIWVVVSDNIKSLLRVLPLRPSAYIADINNHSQVSGVMAAMCRCWEVVRKENYFTVKFCGEYIRIPYGDINYFESGGKKVALHLIKGQEKYTFNEKLDSISQHLPEFFLRCHQSYLVNMNMIKKFDVKNHVLTMINDDEVWISRRMLAYAKAKYEAWAGKPILK